MLLAMQSIEWISTAVVAQTTIMPLPRHSRSRRHRDSTRATGSHTTSSQLPSPNQPLQPRVMIQKPSRIEMSLPSSS